MSSWQIYKMGQEQFDKEFKFVEDFGIHNIAEEIIIQARESAQVEVVRVEDREFLFLLFVNCRNVVVVLILVIS